MNLVTNNKIERYEKIVYLLAGFLLFTACHYEEIDLWDDMEPQNEIFFLPELITDIIEVSAEDNVASYGAVVTENNPEKTVQVTLSIMGMPAAYDREVDVRAVPLSAISFTNEAVEGVHFEFVGNPGLENPIILPANACSVTIPIRVEYSDAFPLYMSYYLQLELFDSKDLAIGLNGWLRTAIVSIRREM